MAVDSGSHKAISPNHARENFVGKSSGRRLSPASQNLLISSQICSPEKVSSLIKPKFVTFPRRSFPNKVVASIFGTIKLLAIYKKILNFLHHFLTTHSRFNNTLLYLSTHKEVSNLKRMLRRI